MSNRVIYSLCFTVAYFELMPKLNTDANILIIIEHDVDIGQLNELTDDHLKELAQKIGDRIRLKQHIRSYIKANEEEEEQISKNMHEYKNVKKSFDCVSSIEILNTIFKQFKVIYNKLYFNTKPHIKIQFILSLYHANSMFTPLNVAMQCLKKLEF